MQKPGLVDTMTDRVINSLGAMLAAVAGYSCIRDDDGLLSRRMIESASRQAQKENNGNRGNREAL